MAKKQDDRDIKSYKLRMLKKDLPKNAVVYVYNKKTKTVDGFVTDRDGKPVPFSEPNIDLDIIVAEGSNQIEVVDGKLRVKEDVGDDYINIVEGPDFFHFSLDDSTLEKISNKQDSLDEDGTGTKYPTVDAVNEKIEELESDIDDIEGDKNFIYNQNTPSATWEITHNLNKKPSVSVTDSANTLVEGQIIINDGVLVKITFNAPFSGTAILN